MWPFLSHALFPPPTEAWLQRASSDSEAQGWGAWSGTEKTSLAPGCGDRKEEEAREAEDNEEDEEDASFSLSLLESEDLAEHPVADQELESIKLKLWAMEQAQGPEPPRAQALAEKEEGSGAMLAQQLLSPETDGLQTAAGKGPLTGSAGLAGSSRPYPGTPVEKMEVDHRSIYVGNVDYGGTAKELEAYFNHCGEVQRVTILCDKFSGHPKGYAYVEFASESSVQAAVELDESIFRGRVIKVLPKRTNLPGISSTDRGGLRKHPGTRGTPFPRSSLQGGAHFRPQGRNRERGRVSLWYSPY